MSTSYLGTVRGRLGVLVTPTWSPYVTGGGLADGGVKASDTVFQVWVLMDSSEAIPRHWLMRLGWAVGAGFEWMFAPRWSAKAEYLHYDLGYGNFTNLLFGNVLTFFYQTDAVSAHFSGDIVRAGINYHFESPPGPVPVALTRGSKNYDRDRFFIGWNTKWRFGTYV